MTTLGHYKLPRPYHSSPNDLFWILLDEIPIPQEMLTLPWTDLVVLIFFPHDPLFITATKLKLALGENGCSLRVADQKYYLLIAQCLDKIGWPNGSQHARLFGIVLSLHFG